MKGEVLAHFDEYLGSPRESLASKGPVDSYVWPWSAGSDECVLATIGMSGLQQTVPSGRTCPSKDPRTELIMFCKKSHVQSASALLADAARYPSRHHSFLHWYHLLPLGRPIVSGSKLDSLLFTFPPIEDERFATFQVGAMRIDVLWTVPLSSSERQFADENGIGELEAALEEHGAAVSDFFRDPVA